MQRFFLPEIQPAVDEVVSLAPIHKQLRHVLRVLPGMQLVLLDNQGNERLMIVETTGRPDTTARVVEMRQALAEPTVALTLYQCILKTDKFDWVLQKATELGVGAVVPVISNRTIVRLTSRALVAKQARWNTIVREAAEQSGRGGLPLVAPACTFAEAIAMAKGVRLLPWEEALGDPGLVAALGQKSQPVEAVSILIGPEGGLEAEEVGAAISAGWQVVTMGARILRAETAALAALSVVTAALGQLGDAPSVKLAVPGKESETAAKSRKRPEKIESGKTQSEQDPSPTIDQIEELSGDQHAEATSAASSVGSPTADVA